MAVTYLNDMRTLAGDSNTILTGRRIRDVAADISLLDANQTALLTLIRQLRRKKSDDVKFEWQEDVFPAKIVTISGTDSTADVTVELSAAHTKLGRAGDLWLVGKTGELIYLAVNNLGTANTWTVVRNVGGTTGGPLTTVDELYYVGTAHPTGHTARAQLTTQISQPYNYCQIFKEAFEADNTLNATKLYGGKDMSYLRYKHAQVHNQDIERAFWFGARDLLTATDHAFVATATHVTKGLVGPDGALGFITSNALGNDSSAYTEDDFDEDLRPIFRYGSGTKFAFCAPMALSVISSWGRGKLQTVPRDTTFGINITRYISPHGELNLINNKLFYDMTDTTEANNIDFTKLVVILDLENIWYRYLRDTTLEMGIQANDKDAVKDQFLTECGLMCKQEKTHGYLTDFDLS